jgi:hypothetical protein
MVRHMAVMMTMTIGAQHPRFCVLVNCFQCQYQLKLRHYATFWPVLGTNESTGESLAALGLP